MTLAYPDIRAVTWAVPNGIKCSITQAKKHLDEGMTRGALDITMAIPNKQYHGLFIEMKIKPNEPSPAQKKMIKALKANGYMVEVCYDIDSAMQITKGYLDARQKTI